MPKPRVFISSTFYNFVQLREDIARFITDLGYEPVRHEAGEVAYGSHEALEHYAYGTVESCDILIALIGGRFGSASSDDRERSISQKELTRAIEYRIPIFIFVEKNVLAEYGVYQVNKDTQGMKFRYADNVKVHQFIEELYALPSNNPIVEFASVKDIVSHLKAQWAGLFQRYLAERRRRVEPESATDRTVAQSRTEPLFDAVLRQLVVGTPTELPEGLITTGLRQGSPDLDLEVVNIGGTVLHGASVELLNLHRWSDEVPEFMDVPEIHDQGAFAPLTLHVKRPTVDGAYVRTDPRYTLVPQSPVVILFASLDGTILRVVGQRGSALGVCEIRTRGTWRATFRITVRGTYQGYAAHGWVLDQTSLLYFRWDGAMMPVPCERPANP
jgi:hypothetical protein